MNDRYASMIEKSANNNTSSNPLNRSLIATSADNAIFLKAKNEKSRTAPLSSSEEHSFEIYAGPEDSKYLKNSAQESSRSSLESQCQEATMKMLTAAGTHFGTEKISRLNISSDDTGSAVTVSLLGPGVCQLLGPDKTQLLGRQIMAFGIAPARGAVDEANKNFLHNGVETTRQGITNMTLGTITGVVVEHINPFIALGVGAMASGLIVRDQMFSQEHQPRNQELQQIAAKLTTASNTDMAAICDRSQELLKGDVYQGVFDLATGGIGVPEGHTLSSATKEELAHSISAINTEEIAHDIKALGANSVKALTDWMQPNFALASEGPAFHHVDLPGTEHFNMSDFVAFVKGKIDEHPKSVGLYFNGNGAVPFTARKVKDLGLQEMAFEQLERSYRVWKQTTYEAPVVWRGDDDFYATVNKKNIPKAHFNEAGDLVPASETGTYGDRSVELEEHVLGNFSSNKKAKAHSPYISFGAEQKVVRTKYGTHSIKVDLYRLRSDIASGAVSAVQITEHHEILKTIENSRLNPYLKQMALRFCEKDREVLVRGTIPARYIERLENK
jgi:hypothetical protein